MFNLDKFISDSITSRQESMFSEDIEANKDTLSREIKGRKVCVIGGAGSMGSSFVKALLRFEPSCVAVVDLNENSLAELVRDIRSTQGLYVPDEFRCYTLNFADPIFERIFREERGFANVAFSSGSLPDGWLDRLQKKQPLAAPMDVRRYFVSPQESGQICLPACILGRGGEVFFPKLGQDGMLTFSAICDDFIRAEGFTKVECSSDAEAEMYAFRMSYDSDTYPIVYFSSDTTGEKAFEEFYVFGEKLDMHRFRAPGVIEQSSRRSLDEINAFFAGLEVLFATPDFTKAQIVDEIKKFIPNFDHEEKGRNLDQKM